MSAPVLLLAEDSRAASFHPLSDTRPMFELRTGIFSMRERAAALLPHFQLHGLARPGVAECWEESSGIPAGWQRVPEARGESQRLRLIRVLLFRRKFPVRILRRHRLGVLRRLRTGKLAVDEE